MGEAPHWHKRTPGVRGRRHGGHDARHAVRGVHGVRGRHQGLSPGEGGGWEGGLEVATRILGVRHVFVGLFGHHLLVADSNGLWVNI